MKKILLLLPLLFPSVAFADTPLITTPTNTALTSQANPPKYGTISVPSYTSTPSTLMGYNTSGNFTDVLVGSGLNLSGVNVLTATGTSPCTSTSNSLQYDNSGAFGCALIQYIAGSGLKFTTTNELLLDSNNRTAIDLYARQGYDQDTPRIDWNQGYLYDAATRTALTWGVSNRYLSNNAGQNTVDWNDQHLIAQTANYVVFDWGADQQYDLGGNLSQDVNARTLNSVGASILIDYSDNVNSGVAIGNGPNYANPRNLTIFGQDNSGYTSVGLITADAFNGYGVQVSPYSVEGVNVDSTGVPTNFAQLNLGIYSTGVFTKYNTLDDSNGDLYVNNGVQGVSSSGGNFIVYNQFGQPSFTVNASNQVYTINNTVDDGTGELYTGNGAIINTASTPGAIFSVNGPLGVPFNVVADTGQVTTLNDTLDDGNGHEITGGPTPTVTSCGGGTPTITGNDKAGTITTGTLTTSCQLNFANAYTAAPVCILSTNSSFIAGIGTVSTSSVTFAFTGNLSNNKIYYHCMQ